jgi:cytochrome P450
MSSVTDEKLLHPTSGSGFYAWGAGPRICPGMKFSQVEFCAVMSSILRKVRVETVTEDARERMLNVLKDSDANPLLLHLRRPEELELRIVER